MANKIVDGIELLRMIRDGELKENTKIEDDLGEKYIYKDDGCGNLTLYKEDIITKEYYTPDYSFFTAKDNKFEIIEDKEIDIEAIEEIEEFELDQFITMNNSERFDRTMIEYSKINELIKAVKQLNKK